MDHEIIHHLGEISEIPFFLSGAITTVEVLALLGYFAGAGVYYLQVQLMH